MPSSKKETGHLPRTTDPSPSLLFPVRSQSILYLVTLCPTQKSSRSCLISSMASSNLIRVKPNCSSPSKILLETLIMASKAILSCWTLLKFLIVSWRAARFVKNCYEREPGTLTNPLNDLNWHSLELRRKIARLITMYKMVNNKVRVNIPESIARPTRVTSSYHSIKFINIGIVTAIPISTFFFYQNSKRMKHATFLFIRSALCGRI